ncbi:MAG: hypothetical protein Q9213_001727 [Squamulea squamosa]
MPISFADFPNEVLVLIFTPALSASTPILNAGIFQCHQYGIAKDKKGKLSLAAGQREIPFGVLSTCKRFHQIGQPILYQQNTFLYTMAEPHWTFSYNPSPLKQRMWTDYPVKAQHLTVRTIHHVSHDGHDVNCQKAIEAIHWISRFDHLETLRIDFVHNSNDRRNCRHMDFPCMAAREHYIKKMEEKILFWEPLSRVLEKPTSSLRSLIFTGLPCNEMMIALVKAYSRYVCADGVVGVGCGARGIQFVYQSWSDGEPHHTVVEDLKRWKHVEIEFRRKNELEGWIFFEDGNYKLEITPFEYY